MKWPFRKRDADLERELRSDLELEEEEQCDRGLSSEEARCAALRAFGNPTLIREQTHETWGWAPVERFLQDLRIAWRVLLRSPIFAITAIVTLALGIGATTAIFSAMNAVLLRRLPVPDPQRLVYLTVPDGQPYGASNSGDSDSSFSLPVFEVLRRNHRAFSEVMAFVPLSTDKVDVRIASQQPEQASGEMVSGNFFSGLGVSLARGRALNLDDEKQHAAVAVVSYSWWTRRFSRDPAVLGQTLCRHRPWRFSRRGARKCHRLLDSPPAPHRPQSLGRIVRFLALRLARLVVPAAHRAPRPRNHAAAGGRRSNAGFPLHRLR